MTWINQFLSTHSRQELPPGPPGSSEFVEYRRVRDIEKKPKWTLTIANAAMTIVNIILAIIILS